MKLQIAKGTINKLVEVFIPDSSSTTGAGLTGVAFGDITAYYYRSGAASAVAFAALKTMTIGTWVTEGFIQIHATNMPGVYQLGLPDLALATGVDTVIVMLKGATNMAPIILEIQLTDVDLNDAVRMGMTALPNANADAAGGLPISDAGGLPMDDIPLAAELEARTLAAADYFDPDVDDVAVVTSVNGFSTAAILSIWDQATSALTTAGRIGKLLVDNINATISSRMPTTHISATTGKINEVALVDLTTANSDMVAEPDNAGIAANGVAIAAVPTAGENADANWDEVITNAVHNDPNSAGKLLRQAGVIVAADGTVNDASATTTSFVTDLAETNSSFYSDQTLIFTSGNLEGQARVITSYNGATKIVTFDEAWTEAPADTDDFSIRADHVHPVSEIVAGILAGGDIDGFTLEETQKLLLAGLSVLAGGATATNTFEAADGSKIRITATVDVDGNRTLVIFDATG